MGNGPERSTYRVQLHAALDEAFGEVGDVDDLATLREIISRRFEVVLSNPPDENIQHVIDSVRRKLSDRSRPGSGLEDFHFSDEVVMQIAEICHERDRYRARCELAVLGALLEAQGRYMTRTMLAQRTGFSKYAMHSYIRRVYHFINGSSGFIGKLLPWEIKRRKGHHEEIEWAIVRI